jgi:hypothetical protein
MEKVATPMRNNSKTLAIDYGGYRLTFNMILLLELGFWLLTTGTGFNLEGGVWKGWWRREGSGFGGGARVAATMLFYSEIGMVISWGGAPKLI